MSYYKNKIELPDLYLYANPKLSSEVKDNATKVKNKVGNLNKLYKVAKNNKVWYMDTETYPSPEKFNEEDCRASLEKERMEGKEKLNKTDLKWIEARVEDNKKKYALNPRTNMIRLVQLKLSDSVHIIDLMHVNSDMKELFQMMKGKHVVFQNAKFDMSTIYAKHNVLPKKVFDTMIANRMIEYAKSNIRSPSDLGSIVEKYLSINLPKDQGSSDWSAELSVDQIIYAYHDVAYLDYIAKTQIEMLNNQTKKRGQNNGVLGLKNFIAIEEMEFTKTVTRVELNGILLNKKGLHDHAYSLKPKLDELKKYFKEEGCNYNSPMQVRKYLLEVADLDLPKADKATLSEHNNVDAVKKVLEVKKISKEHKTILDYIEKHSEGAYLYPNFNTLHASTGRTSCYKPNVQQIPRTLKNIIYKPLSNFEVWRYDYPGEEVRIAGQISTDLQIIKNYKEGKDIHKTFASICFNVEYDDVTPDQRQEAKAAVFGLLYGMSTEGFQRYAKESFGLDYTFEYADNLRAKFYNTFKGWKRYYWYIKNWLKDADHIVLDTLYGRRAYTDNFTNSINYSVQGSASDIIKIAMNRIQKDFNKRGMKSHMISMVHDEIVFQVHMEEKKKADQIIRNRMEQSINNVVTSFETKIEGEKVKSS